MKLNRILAPLFLLFTAVSADAVVVRGVVTEVRDGQSIVVVVNGRKLNVQLRGVAAPVLIQDFGGLSRLHLSNLVLDKPVEVQFSQLQSEQVVARIIWNDLDIGLQLIRDGAAWFDKVGNHSMTDEERALYSEAERLARNEMRGLWSDGSPMPPWEWKRAQEARLAARLEQVATTYKPRPASALESADILSSRAEAPPTPGSASPKARSTPKPTAKPLNVPGQDFNFQSYFTPERVSIVYFYADWCPACQSFNPIMEAVNAQIPDMQVLFMNIDDWNTPLTRRYNVTSVPYLMIYDKGGNLVAEGRNAKTWLHQALAKKAGRQ
ncbi:MAG TPA: thioredoxin domain-containing protein [Pyrinomonadaceae bacterium]|nr:thioredoxin domain-containing protein [Pyrinomonadaceae bacterium]